MPPCTHCSLKVLVSRRSAANWISRAAPCAGSPAPTRWRKLLTHNGTGHRRSLLEEFKPYLWERFNAGHANAAILFTEITARGYRGGPTLVRHYLHGFRADADIPRPAHKLPSVRRVAGWIMTDPAKIASADQQRLDAILAANPSLNALAGHVRGFATMMCSLRGQDLEAWMSAVDADDQPALRSFVVGLRRDQDAVTAGLTLPWSSGVVEGHVNRLTMLKRQMFGRAKPDLLRKRASSSPSKPQRVGSRKPCQNQNSNAVDSLGALLSVQAVHGAALSLAAASSTWTPETSMNGQVSATPRRRP
jgi:Transposase